MKFYFIKKVFLYLLTFFLILTFNFFLVRFMPGDPLLYIIGEEDYEFLSRYHPEQLDEIRSKYGLDKHIGEQYTAYLGELIKGNVGYSYKNKQPINHTIFFRFKWSLILIIPALVVGAVLGSVLGTAAGWRKGSKLDLILTNIMLFIRSVPSYAFAMIFLVVFSFHLGILPAGGMSRGYSLGMTRVFDVARHMILPFSVLVSKITAYDYLIMRSSVIQVKCEDYILTAATKGLNEKQTLFRHVMRNALIPFMTVFAMQIGFVASGSMMVEVVFSWQGMGTLIYRSVFLRDYPMLQGCFTLLAIFVITANLVVDIMYPLIDPRVKGRDTSGV